MLYRNRYLIAVYDKEDFLTGVYDNPNELAESFRCPLSTIKSALARHQKKLYLIDVYDIQDDIFIETDISLLEMYKAGEITQRPIQVIAQECNCSRRTVFRKMEILNGL